ncbi:hypothetical protein MMC14_000888 [Varicellaria rhodocarpa]|nr:hypothetical protein [Varicellaria rhodocarpa]
MKFTYILSAALAALPLTISAPISPDMPVEVRSPTEDTPDMAGPGFYVKYGRNTKEDVSPDTAGPGFYVKYPREV